MRTTVLSLVILAACAGETSITDPPALARAGLGTPVVFNTQLQPGNEIRTAPVTDPVESIARGHAQIKLFPDNTLTFKITVQNPGTETFILGHIHQAPVGINGPIVIDLLGAISQSGTLIKLEATLPPIPADLAAAIRADPSGFYVNLHTTLDPQGAVRGQLP
jgi:hypothetical protein